MSGQRCKIDGKEIHATIKNEPSFSSQVTEHTNEAGANITDHVRPKLVVLSIEGVCSDLDDGAFDNGTDAQSMHSFFADLFANPRAVKIETPRTVYDAMVMREYRPKAESKFASALHFSAEFVEFKTVGTATSTIQVQKSRVNKGPQQPKNSPAPPLKSAAASATDVADGPLANAPHETPNGSGGIEDPVAGMSRPGK